jgi:hypothetical protein
VTRARGAWPAALGLALSGLALAGCGSDAGPSRESQPEPESPAAVRARVLDRCGAFARALCDSAESCCTSQGAFSADACESEFASNVCRPAADLAAEGLATYDENAEAACLEAHQNSHRTCTADWEAILELRREVWSKCKVVQGTSEPGRGCSVSAQCVSPPGEATARCVQNVCRVLELLPEGAECPYPNGDVSVCDSGLYCTSTERDLVGTCLPVTPEGAECDPVALNPECGLGSYCGLDDGRCHRATDYGGGSCAQDTECVSFLCGDVTKTCADAPPTAGSLCAE